jgi:hypothetical protein
MAQPDGAGWINSQRWLPTSLTIRETLLATADEVIQ